MLGLLASFFVGLFTILGIGVGLAIVLIVGMIIVYSISEKLGTDIFTFLYYLLLIGISIYLITLVGVAVLGNL